MKSTSIADMPASSGNGIGSFTTCQSGQPSYDATPSPSFHSGHTLPLPLSLPRTDCLSDTLDSLSCSLSQQVQQKVTLDAVDENGGHVRVRRERDRLIHHRRKGLGVIIM